MSNEKTPYAPEISQLDPNDPMMSLLDGLDVQVSEAVIEEARDILHELAEDSAGSHDLRVLSATSTAFIYGTMYVMIEVFKELKYSPEDASEQALNYVTTAATMVAKTHSKGVDH